MSYETKIFIYRDARGNITERQILNVSQSEVYIQGICSVERALRTFRKDRVLEEFSNISDMAGRLQYHIEKNPPPNAVNPNNRSNPLGNPEICFTGFKKEDKEALTKLAKSSGMFIRSSVTKKLDFLCCGYNAGPAKIEKSRHQGVVALSETQFKTLLETGEIPEDG